MSKILKKILSEKTYIRMREHKDKIEGQILKLPEAVYNGIIVILIIAEMFFSGSMLYIYHSFRYIGYEQSKAEGTIEYRGKDEFEYEVKFKSHTAHKYYFSIDGEWLRVSEWDYEKYRSGDTYSFYEYTKGGNVYRSVERLSLIKALGLVLIQLLIITTIYLFFDAVSVKKKIKAEPIIPESRKVQDYSKKELYDLCIEYGINIDENKRNNRHYLEKAIRREKERQKWRKEQEKKDRKFNLIFDSIIIIIGIIVCLWYGYIIEFSVYGLF